MCLNESFGSPAGPKTMNTSVAIITPININIKCLVRMAARVDFDLDFELEFNFEFVL